MISNRHQKIWIRVTSEPYFEDYVRETYQIREDRGDNDQQKEDIDDSSSMVQQRWASSLEQVSG